MILREFSKLSILCALLLPAFAGAQSEPPPPETDQVVPVADEDVESIGEEASIDERGEEEVAADEADGMSDEERLVAEFERYKQLMDDNVLDEADSSAKRIVELAINVSGPRSPDMAKALTNLAIVQYRREQYGAAQQNFESAIDIIEDNEDRLHRSLVNPLKGLGAAQLEAGRPDLAARSYGRAVHITHVNEGPHNMGQIELLESLAETNLRMGEFETAKDLHDTIYSLNVREFDQNQLKLVDPLMRRAAWQHRAGYVNDERATYRRVIRIIESEGGKDDMRLIEPLQRLGNSYFFEDTSGQEHLHAAPMTSGEIYFKRALRIAESNPESNWSIEADAKLALGDYYMFQANQSRARRLYRDAWELLSADDERLEMRKQLLEQIVPLRVADLPRYVGDATRADRYTSDETLLTGKVTVNYSVTDRGRVSDLQLVEARPEEFDDMESVVMREMRSRLFRPRFEEGDPVGTDDLTFTHTFFYRQSELEDIREAASGAGMASSDSG